MFLGNVLTSFIGLLVAVMIASSPGVWLVGVPLVCFLCWLPSRRLVKGRAASMVGTNIAFGSRWGHDERTDGELHPLHGSTPLVFHGGGYIVWALMQQFILQDFFLLRLLRILPTRTNAVIAAALLFAIAHVPNPLLVTATVV